MMDEMELPGLDGQVEGGMVVWLGRGVAYAPRFAHVNATRDCSRGALQYAALARDCLSSSVCAAPSWRACGVWHLGAIAGGSPARLWRLSSFCVATARRVATNPPAMLSRDARAALRRTKQAAANAICDIGGR